ncbi:hypothetical protein [Roseateles sp.]|uniref:hypothetical protein n=1 Tax=Roseateles sp. TaxID=1971397 RepID=UPI003BA8F57C
MQTNLSPNDIERLRREAKQISRDEGCTYTEAINRQAVKMGYPNWALMQHAVSTMPRRFPIFDRSLDEMRQAFRKVKGLDGMRDADTAMRRQMPDLSTQFANPMSALEYARDYLELALSLPRFDPHMHSVAWIEMRVLLPYVFEPLTGTDRFIVLGRDYKPLGMANREDHIDYEAYKNLHVHLPAAELSQATRHTDYKPGYLHGVNPMAGRKYAAALLKQIETVIKLVSKYERSNEQRQGAHRQA